MLGRHPVLRAELESRGVRALAKVRKAKRTQYIEGRGVADTVGGRSYKRLWKLVLLVEPEGVEPFEAKVDELLPNSYSIEPSERHYAFAVLYDPEDHSKVVVDQSDEGNRMLDAAQNKERVDGQVARMRARGQDVWADRYQQAEDSLSEFRKNLDPNLSADEREDLWEQQRQKMKATMAGDTEQRVEQIRARQQQLQAIARDSSLSPAEKQAKMADIAAEVRSLSPGGVASPPVTVAGAQPVASGPAGAASAAADALAKLADLRDRGVLTEDEFQAQKHKLLGD